MPEKKLTDDEKIRKIQKTIKEIIGNFAVQHYNVALLQGRECWFIEILVNAEDIGRIIGKDKKRIEIIQNMIDEIGRRYEIRFGAICVSTIKSN